MEKKIVSGIMLALLLAIMMRTPFVRAEIYLYDLVFIEPEVAQVYVGGHLSIAVRFEYGWEPEHPRPVEFSLGWNASLLELIDWMSLWGATVIVEDDYMRVSTDDPFAIILILTFKAKAVGSTILDLYDSNVLTSDGYVDILPPPATVDIKPDTLNLLNKAEWITCYIELPEGNNVSEIDRLSIMLNDTIPVDPYFVDVPIESLIGDYDEDGITDLMVKFNRTMVSEFILSMGIMYGNVTLTTTGKVAGTPFEGSDVIRVRMPGDVNCDGYVDILDLVMAAAALGSTDPYRDLNEDGIIDIFDLVIISVNFGKKW